MNLTLDTRKTALSHLHDLLRQKIVDDSLYRLLLTGTVTDVESITDIGINLNTQAKIKLPRSQYAIIRWNRINTPITLTLSQVDSIIDVENLLSNNGHLSSEFDVTQENITYLKQYKTLSLLPKLDSLIYTLNAILTIKLVEVDDTTIKLPGFVEEEDQSVIKLNGYLDDYQETPNQPNTQDTEVVKLNGFVEEETGNTVHLLEGFKESDEGVLHPSGGYRSS